MNRIDKTFKELREQKKKAFIPYITAGDPDMKTSFEAIKALASAGADIIEIGIPFSDPIADGPTIQKAVQRSLDAGCSVKKVFDMVKSLRKHTDVPFVFMTYYNIVLNYGLSGFVGDALKSGADGIIVPDLPIEEADELIKHADKGKFDVILLAAPTTPLIRFKKIARRSRGFIYYVSLTGVTGARKDIPKKITNVISILKKATNKPICVGFGVSTPGQAKKIADIADGVIVGSALINVIDKNIRSKKKIVSEIKRFASALAKAVHSV